MGSIEPARYKQIAVGLDEKAIEAVKQYSGLRSKAVIGALLNKRGPRFLMGHGLEWNGYKRVAASAS
jgi:hypothetical protein